MRSLLIVAPLVALLAGSAYAQQPAVGPACGIRSEREVKHLEDLARQYHPEAFAPAAQRSLIVGFVFDTTCQVVRHAVGLYGPGSAGTVDSEIAELFPGLRTSAFRSAGTYSRAPLEPGSLRIVWAVTSER